MRGKQKSKPIEVLVEEARGLALGGVKELVLVAEDSTAFGMDRDGRRRTIHELVAALAAVDGIEWIRILYAYPHTVSRELTTVMRETDEVVKYLDIPIQHISGKILKAMKRGVSGTQVRSVLDRLRTEVPGIAIRTTLIAGFPGETDADFEELLRFVEEYRFERLGAFPFSPEEGTPALALGDRVPEEVVRERLDRIMAATRRIIEERNATLIGSVQRCLVDGRAGDGSARWVARTFADAPEIDCTVSLAGEGLRSGEFVEVEITGADGFDLVGEPVAAREALPAGPRSRP
jgi:ribosomal protein S12 methylthiotransferase